MIRLLLIATLATVLPLGGPGMYAQAAGGDSHAVAGAVGSAAPPCCAPAPAAGDALPCAGSGGGYCPAPAVLTDASLVAARIRNTTPVATGPGAYLSPALPGLFRPPNTTRV